MKAIDRVLELYGKWLSEHHPALDVAATKNAARGILMVAGVDQVTQAHVDHSVELARDANCAEEVLAEIAQRGALFLEFQADNSVRWEPAPPVAPVVTFRKKTGGASPSAAAGPDASTPPASAQSDGTATAKPAAASTPRSAGVAAAAALALAGAAAVWWFVLRSDSSTPSEKGHVRAPASKVLPKGRASGSEFGKTGLSLELPAGWTYAAKDDAAHPGPLGAPLRTARAFTKGANDKPAHELLVGTTKLPPNLASQWPLNDAVLLSIVKYVEYNIARKVQTRGAYKAGTCEVFNDLYRRRAAVCGGDAYSLSATSSVHTYVRLDKDRAVIALFVAGESVAEPRRTADRIFGSMR